MMRIGTWNLENLFPPGTPGGPTTGQAYQAKLAALAETIAALDPDVLAVQEVGDPSALDDLAKAVGGYPHTATADPDGRGIRVGFLSKLPLLDVQQNAAFPPPLRPIQVDDTPAATGAMSRPALVAAVTTPGGTRIDLITCHLKSKLLTFPGGSFTTGDEDLRARVAAYALFRRAAEAATVRATATTLLGEKGRQRAVIVLGDLNDTLEAATTQLLSGPPGSEIGTPGYDQPDRGDGQRLWNLAARILPPEQRYSRIYRGSRELIDHVLGSHLVTRHVGDGDVIAGGPVPASVGDDPAARRNAPASDHRPLVASIDL
ncbi:endonuclease/exonuclease/phosphatase family protein [Geodermatophilus sp. SYSU D00814]